MYLSTRKATAAKINNQVCSARKEMTWPAVLKRKLAIWPIRPGRRDAVFSDLFKLIPYAFPQGFQRVSNSTNDSANRDTSSKKDSCNSDAVFVENLFYALTQGHCSFCFSSLISSRVFVELSFSSRVFLFSTSAARLSLS